MTSTGDSAMIERARIVAWLRKERDQLEREWRNTPASVGATLLLQIATVKNSFSEIADSIERGEHLTASRTPASVD